MDASRSWEVSATYHSNPVSIPGVDCFRTDLTDADCVVTIRRRSPDLIIHCAAQTGVDFCEEHPEEAYRQNVLASVRVAEAARQSGARLIHISTDAVFPGDRGDYRESDLTGPANVYGKTKLEAERQVAAALPDACIARTNIYGWNLRNKSSLAEWMIDRLDKKERMPAFRDVIFTPLLVNDLGDALFDLYRRDYHGVIHVCGGEACSKMDFAYLIADVFGLDPGLILPSSVDGAGLKAPRGKNTSLNTDLAARVLGRRLPGVRQGLERMRRLKEDGYVEELKHG